MTDLILPQGFRYDCVSCGKSCWQTWDVPVDRQLAENLRPHKLQAEGYQPFRELPDGRLSLQQKEDARCVFLDDETLCRIHSQLGFQSKPLTCRQFPFLFQATPAGVYVGLSFMCTSIQQGSGRPLEEHRELLNALAQELDLPEPEPDFGVEILDGHGVDWETYLGFEERLRERLKSGPPEEVLIETAFKLMSVAASAHYRELLETVLNGIETLVVAQVESPGDDQQRQLIKQAHPREAFYSPRLDEDLPPLKRATGFESKLFAYLDHLLFRKFLVGGALLGRLLFLVVARRLVLYYAAVSAHLRDSKEVAEEDLYRALDVVELKVMMHATGYQQVFEWLVEDFKRVLEDD